MGTSSSKPTDSSILNKTAEDGDDIATRESKQKAVDVLQAEVPKFIDDESRTQVEDYKQACNDGKGPMVACFATAEFISLFELLHNESNDLYRNVCFRPLTDKSPNGVRVDDTMAYPPGCFNLARNLITGKGIEPNRVEAYNILDRACRGDHGGACFLQAKILLSPIGSFAEGVPHDPKKAMELFENNCNERNDSISCYSLANLLLRGDRVNKAADNVSPQEAQGIVPIVKRQNEKDRSSTGKEPYVIPRDPKKAEALLKKGCDINNHVTSCHNLAVMYGQGDDGVPANEELAEKYKKKTRENLHFYGGFGG